MKLIVAHPYRLIGDALKCILSSQDSFEIDGVFQSIDDVITRVSSDAPSVDAIVVSGLLVGSQSDAIKAIKQIDPAIGILVVSTVPRSDELLKLLEIGASGYVSLDSTAFQLVDSVRKVAAGEVVLCGIDRNALKAAPEQATGPTDARASAVESLTPREREVLSLLSRGFSNRQIADSLFLSEHTVRTHVQNLRGKLNVRSKFEAAMLAMRSTSTAAPATSQMRF